MTRWSSDLGDDSSRSWWRKIIIVMVVGCSWSSVGSCESGKAKAAAISTHIGYNDTVVVANKNLELPWELDWKQRQIINDLSFTIIISDMHWSTKMLSLTASQSAVFLPAAPLSLCCLLFPISLDPLSDGHDISTTNERTSEAVVFARGGSPSLSLWAGSLEPPRKPHSPPPKIPSSDSD